MGIYELQWNLYEATTKFCGLSRQVVSHDSENKHDFVKTVPDKCWNLCVFSKTYTVFNIQVPLCLYWSIMWHVVTKTLELTSLTHWPLEDLNEISDN